MWTKLAMSLRTLSCAVSRAMLTGPPKVIQRSGGATPSVFSRAVILLFSAAQLFVTVVPALCGGFLPANPFTDEARGLCSAQFLKVPPSARFAALAGAGLTLDGPDSFFFNPAGAASRSGSAFSASYESLLEGASRTGLVFSGGAAAGVFSAGLLYNNSFPGLEKLDGAGGGTGSEITAYDAALGAGWARRFSWVDFGFDLKYLKSRLAEASGASAAVDAGLVFRDPSPRGTELAVALRNFGPPLKLGSEKAPLPFELAGGLKWKYTRDMNIFIEGRLPADHSPYLVFAGEWFIHSSPLSGLFLRSGLNFKNYYDHGFMGTFSGGFGLKLGGFSADYAFSPYGELGAAHRMTLGLAWGGPPAPEEIWAGPAAPRETEKRKRKDLPGDTTLAVAPFSSETGVTETEAAVLRNLVESELVKTGTFQVVERSKLDFILNEKRLAYSGIFEDKAAVELAKLSGARLAVFGSVNRNEHGYSVTVRLVDAATGEILRSGTEFAEEDYLFRDASRRIAAAFAAR